MVKQMNAATTKVYAAIKEAVALFPRKRDGVVKIVNITIDVAAYLREKCGADLDLFESGIEEIERDCHVYLSRVNYLEDRLGGCERMVDSIKANDSSDKTQGCIDAFIEWHKLNRDFSKCFSKAQSRWLTRETDILNIVEGTL